MPYSSLMGILAVYALSLIYEKGGQMGTAIWRLILLAGNKIANYLLSISIIFLVQTFYPELLIRYPRSGRHHTRMANKSERYANPVSPKEKTWPEPI